MLAAAALENVLAISSAALGVTTALWAALAAARTARTTRDAVARAQAASPDAAMSSLSLQALGDYVYGTLGTIPIAEYAANRVARANVAHALERIERFVSEDESITGREPEQDNAIAWFAQGRRALDSGDYWRSLAQLRRAVEIALRNVAQQREIRVPERAGAGRMLSILDRAHGIPDEAAAPLRYAVDVANRAVHGEDVSPGLAYEAFDAAESAFRLIGAFRA
jgi:tetratricopeptide (TPR) repeat protein